MPKAILDDGTEVEVPSQDELQKLQEKAKQAEQLELDLKKANEALTKKDSPDWRNARRRMEKQDELLKAQGKAVDDDGNVIDVPATQQPINPDEIIKRAEEAATKKAQEVALTNYKNELLNSFDKDSREVVEHYYNKLSQGEELTFDSIRKFINEASRHVSPNASTRRPVSFGGSSGGAPRYDLKSDGSLNEKRFSETEDGAQVAKEIWGDSAYSSKK